MSELTNFFHVRRKNQPSKAFYTKEDLLLFLQEEWDETPVRIDIQQKNVPKLIETFRTELNAIDSRRDYLEKEVKNLEHLNGVKKGK